MRRLSWAAGLVCFCFAAGVARGADPEYVVGGPLAGWNLPARPGGWYGDVQLYPGCVEHWQGYWAKYLPVRSPYDQQTLVKRWIAPEIPGATKESVTTYAEPWYHVGKFGTATASGKNRTPVPVVRWSTGGPTFALDTGVIGEGMYCVRVIGAVPTGKLRPFREPLYIRMSVNEGPQGEIRTDRFRIGYLDEFASVAEMYFHAPAKRGYHIDLRVDDGSTVELLVHDVILDDVLAGMDRRAIKTKRTMTPPDEMESYVASTKKDLGDKKFEELRTKAPLSAEDRLQRDADLWRLPYQPFTMVGSMNRTPVRGYTTPGYVFAKGGEPRNVQMGAPGKTMAQIEAEFGKWERVACYNRWGVPNPGFAQTPYLVNKKLKLNYSREDAARGKPLPAPYPYPDDGLGLYFPDPKDPAKGRVLSAIPPFCNDAYVDAADLTRPARFYLATGNQDLGRDAAIMLVRAAYDAPALDDTLALAGCFYVPNYLGRDPRFRQRYCIWTPPASLIKAYDMLFDLLRTDPGLAQSVSRFVPWVKTPADVVKLLDVYLVQLAAKRYLRYEDVFDNQPTRILREAQCLGDAKLSDPWLEWLFTRAWVYPNPPSSIMDLFVRAYDRQGCGYIGSTSYATGESAERTAGEFDDYFLAAGTRNPKYDLTNKDLFPKAVAHCQWLLDRTLGGADFPRIGDVGGPDKAPLVWAIDLAARDEHARGWRWSGDPRFAWTLQNVFGRKFESDADWRKIEAAAATVHRAPWLDNRSRVLSDWFVALESGLEHDDYRFRRAVYARTGLGLGHDHCDTLDLQVIAHGLPMTIDGGQRSGYSKPNDRFTRTHNTVEVDPADEGFGHKDYSWTRTLSDAPGARYFLAAGIPPAGATVYQRQVSLLDVDEGAGSQPMPTDRASLLQPLPPKVTTANSYVFDVFRVAGGRVHSYGFHGMVNDQFAFNAQNVAPVETVKRGTQPGTDADFLSIFTATPESKFAGVAPETLEATWRYSRNNGDGSEQRMLGKSFDPASSRKFTRLHLMGVAGSRVLRADVKTDDVVKYRWTQLLVQRRAPEAGLQSVFTAIIEPYAGTPFLTAQRLLPVDGNDSDALRAVAVEVETANGHRDVCFADGRPDRLRNVESGMRSPDFDNSADPTPKTAVEPLRTPHSEFRISGEFAYYSIDAQGLRQATLTGGTLLQAPEVRLETARREWTATVTAVDYPAKTMTIDASWPVAAQGRPFEIGTPATAGAPAHLTTYTSSRIVADGKGSKITVTEGADFYRGGVLAVDGAKSAVRCKLGLPIGAGSLHQGWVGSNDQMTKFWRVDVTVPVTNEPPSELGWVLRGAPVAEADFQPAGVLRLWEYGVGDQLRLPVSVSLRRTGENIYELRSDTGLALSLKGRSLEVSPDGRTWKPLSTATEGGWMKAVFTDADLAAPLYLKLAR